MRKSRYVATNSYPSRDSSFFYTPLYLDLPFKYQNIILGANTPVDLHLIIRNVFRVSRNILNMTYEIMLSNIFSNNDKFIEYQNGMKKRVDLLSNRVSIQFIVQLVLKHKITVL